MGGPNDVMKYNLCDVAALVVRLRPTHKASDRASSRGASIVLTKARDEFKVRFGFCVHQMHHVAYNFTIHQLTAGQLRRLVPRDIRPNPHGQDKPDMTIFNRADVEVGFSPFILPQSTYVSAGS